MFSIDERRQKFHSILEYKEIIGTRVIGFTFLKDVIRFPQDPYGQFGPSLDEILNGKEK